MEDAIMRSNPFCELRAVAHWPLRLGVVLVLSTVARADGPPRVVEMSPKNRAADVDAKTTKQISVTFDRPMDTNIGWSLCGGGPSFPKTKGTPRWKDGKTLIVEVELEPNHDYSLSLN